MPEETAEECVTDQYVTDEYTIGQAADLLGVTPRTLRHWEECELLIPSYRTWSDYRLYTNEDVQRGLDILVYRETGMPLKTIAEVLDSSSSVTFHLEKQRELLAQRKNHIDLMIKAVDKLLTADQSEEFTMKEKAEMFGPEWSQHLEYQEEAQARWGNTPEWEESQKKAQQLTKEDFSKIKEEMDSFNDALRAAQTAGVKPGSEEARPLVLRHRAQIGQWYECTPAKQVLLARMYVNDERFSAHYQGLAPYLLELIEAEAQQEGVDLSAVEWG